MGSDQEDLFADRERDQGDQPSRVRHHVETAWNNRVGMIYISPPQRWGFCLAPQRSERADGHRLSLRSWERAKGSSLDEPFFIFNFGEFGMVLI